MNLNKLFYNLLFIFIFLSPQSFADNHDKDLNKNNTKPVPSVTIEANKTNSTKSIEEELNDVPLNNPFGGGVGSAGGLNNMGNANLTAGIAALQGVKLVGIIKGRSKKYALFQNPNGSIQTLSVQDSVVPNIIISEIQNEVVMVVDNNKKYYEVEFNSIVRPSEGNR